MSLRTTLYEWAGTHRLDEAATARLFDLAGLAGEPPDLPRRTRRGVGILGAALGGLGLVMWVASNWDTLGRLGRLGLLGAFVAATAAGAAALPRARAPLALLAFLGIGGLFAAFGQAYQAGTDPWQLFALWAVLGLPLALACRSDVLWAPWALVSMVGLSLWVRTHTGHAWRVEPSDLPVFALGWGLAIAVVAALGPVTHRWTGAGPWSLRTAVALAALAIVASALGALFGRELAPQYPLALGLLAATAWALGRPAWFDVFGLSAVALALDTLLVAGLARLSTEGLDLDAIPASLLTGLVAAGMLAATAWWVVRVARAHGPAEDAP